MNRLRYAAPQWKDDLHRALERARHRLAHARIDELDWYWPADEEPGCSRHAPDDELRLLAPFDPVVWDRRRFELLWGWAYRLEAYTPPAQRRLGSYALPLLWREHVIGWGNLAVSAGRLQAELGYSAGHAPRDPAFRRALERELERMARFLGAAR